MRKYFYLLFSFLFVAVFSEAQSQFRCGSDEVRARLIAEHPEYKRNLEDMDRGIQHYISTHPPTATSSTSRVAATLYYIPVVVHVIYDGNATVPSTYNPAASQITSAIDYINAVYDGSWNGTGGPILGAGDLQIKFVLATKDPSGNATTGIDRVDGSVLAGYSASGVKLNGATGADELTVKNLSRWDPEKFYNIWMVSKIDGCTGIFCGCSCDAGYVAGFAYFPMPPTSSTASDDIKYDGTLMVTAQFVSGQKTLPHELGHMLNLYHPFEGNDPLSNGSNNCPTNTNPTTDGDACADTDPITNPQFAGFACRTGPNACAPGNNYGDNTEKNYMNYTGCYQLFTNDQRTRMQASVATTQRTSLATSWANNQDTYPATFVAPIAAAITPVSLLTTNNLAGITNVTLTGPGVNKTVYSFNATNDGGYLDNSTHWYDAFVLNPNSAYVLSITTAGTNHQQYGAWIDYNNDGIFNSGTEQLFVATDVTPSAYSTTYSINFTTPSTWVGANNFVRLRVMEDLSTFYGFPAITNLTATLKYGQAEDYAVFLQGGVVPVSLLSFTGTQTKAGNQLNWKTAQEINTATYSLERSVSSSSFAAIGTVAALGTATGAAYNFNDADISVAGDYLYRLKIIDRDGSFAYSNIVKLHSYGIRKLEVIGNPFTDHINLQLPDRSGSAAFRLMDAAGRVVFNQQIMLTASNVTLYTGNAQLSAGMYILSAVINGETYTVKLAKK